MNEQNQNLTLVQKAYEEIKEKISSLEFFPGMVMSDYQLSKELNMSRTPIRQALLNLKRDGLLVETAGRKGFSVSRITAEDVAELFEAREGLEGTALKIAFKKGISDQDISDLYKIHKEIVEAYRNGKLRDAFDQDQRLHDKIVSMARNDRITAFHETLSLQIKRMRFLTFFDQTLSEISCDEHENLLHSINEQNMDTAMAILSQHIKNTSVSFQKILTRPSFSGDLSVLRFINDKK